VDQITHVTAHHGADRPRDHEPIGTIVCRYDLRRAAPLLTGHFPERPLWPGVLQFEAVGQAGLCLIRLVEGGVTSAPACTLTDILAGRCMRPVVPDGDVEVVAQALSDGLFVIVVGQCLKEGLVCSAAALRGLETEVPA
jgi:3-hydroxymyristoyl/3-hydroxydecanoyl-(acyl carrier protein) dehydratase